jgi:hypothetical protein
MADPNRKIREAELERALASVGELIDYPTLDRDRFTAAVVRRIVDLPAPAREPVLARLRGRVLRPGHRRPVAPVFRPAWERAAAALVAVVVLFSGVLVFSPGARRAVAGWLGLGGVRIVVTPTQPTAPRLTLGEGLDLGDRVTVDRARALVSYRVLVPSVLGSPDQVYESPELPGGGVSLVYRAGPGLPRASTTGVGLLVTEFRADLNDIAIQKSLGPTTRLESVNVNGQTGFWIEGELHGIVYTKPDGEPFLDTARLAQNVLLWQQGEVTLRIECSLTRDQALRIAQSMG